MVLGKQFGLLKPRYYSSSSKSAKIVRYKVWVFWRVKKSYIIYRSW